MKAEQETDSTVPESFVASPVFLTASLTGFALLALDVFGPSAHLLSSVDNGERLAVSLVSRCLRDISVTKGLSNVCSPVSLMTLMSAQAPTRGRCQTFRFRIL